MADPGWRCAVKLMCEAAHHAARHVARAAWSGRFSGSPVGAKLARSGQVPVCDAYRRVAFGRRPIFE